MPFRFVVAFFALSLVPITAAAQSGLDALAGLAGCWIRDGGSRIVEEQWMRPAGGSMLGMSRTVRDGRLAAYEAVLLYQVADTLVYRAHPGGQPGAEFRAVGPFSGEVVFENPREDFPTRIGYGLVGTDSLHAWISGKLDGVDRRMEYPYRRAACPGS